MKSVKYIFGVLLLVVGFLNFDSFVVCLPKAWQVINGNKGAYFGPALATILPMVLITGFFGLGTILISSKLLLNKRPAHVYFMFICVSMFASLLYSHINQPIPQQIEFLLHGKPITPETRQRFLDERASYESELLKRKLIGQNTNQELEAKIEDDINRIIGNGVLVKGEITRMQPFDKNGHSVIEGFHLTGI